jgi:hypothetical protein
MTKQLIFSNLNLKLYQLPYSNSFDFEIETPLENGNCMSLKTSDNAVLCKWLENGGVCADRLQALDLINHGFVM